jgi:hypothetical protein
MPHIILIFAMLSTLLYSRVEQSATEAKCKATDESKSSVHLSYVRMSKTNQLSQSKREETIQLRLSNRSSCDVYLSTVQRYDLPTRKTSKKNEIFSPQDGQQVEIVYIIDNSWGWGDSLKSLRLKRGRSLIFSVPISKLKNAARVEVPTTFDPPVSDSVASFSPALMLDTLPPAVRRAIYQ